jgi:hypothetical protein
MVIPELVVIVPKARFLIFVVNVAGTNGKE